MGYIEKNLLNDENVLYRARLHWIIFVWPLIWTVLLFVSFYNIDFLIFSPIVIVIVILSGLISLIKYMTSEFGITNKRVIAKTGFIRRNSTEVLLNKIEGIQVNQSILGKNLNYGTITVIGTGGTRDPFKKISAPLEFRKRVQEQIITMHPAA